MNVDASTIIRAWRDPRFAASLPKAVRDAIPASPAGRSVHIDASEARDGARAVEPQGTITADCRTITADCRTITSDCRTITSECRTVTAGCRTITSDCRTITAGCRTITSDCDTRITCTRSTGC